MKFILNYSTWRCGSTGKHTLGEGPTRLLNPEGFMCCLGQFSLQANTELRKRDMMGICSPASVRRHINFLTEEGENTLFSARAMEINDDNSTTPEYKIEQLTELCISYDHELEVINKP